MPSVTLLDLQQPVVMGTGYSAGNIAFNFSGVDQNGNRIALYSYFGRYVILEFCASWCTVSNSIAPVVNRGVTTISANDYPVVLLHILLQNGSQQSATQVDATRWATRYQLTSPVLHPAGVLLSDSNLMTTFTNYSTPELGGRGYPTFVYLSPALKILRVQVGAGSANGDGLMTSDEVYQFIYRDVSTNPLHATMELRALLNSLTPRPMLAAQCDQQLGSAIEALQRSDKLSAHTFLTLFNQQVGMSSMMGGFNSDQQRRLLAKSNAILRML